MGPCALVIDQPGSIGSLAVCVARRRGPQGASASPLLSNVYLHYVFDVWADQ